MPLGALTQNTWPLERDDEDKSRWKGRYLSYNEYIVYKEEQVCLRYIIQFR